HVSGGLRMAAVMAALASSVVGCRSASNLSTATGGGAAVDPAIARGAEFLASRQHEDGSFGSGAYPGHVAGTAFAGRTLMAAGGKPASGPLGDRVTKCVDYLLSCANEEGLIVSKQPGEPPMYGHAFAMVFLAEYVLAGPAGGQNDTNQPKVRDALT